MDQLLGFTEQLNRVHQVGLQLLKKGLEFYEKQWIYECLL
jgi:hypothetical protein